VERGKHPKDAGVRFGIFKYALSLHNSPARELANFGYAVSEI
jgi:hypothetical protein